MEIAQQWGFLIISAMGSHTVTLTKHPRLPLQRLLLLSICSHIPSLHQQSLPPADTVHVPLGHILPVAKLAQIFQVVLREGNPEGILIQNLVTRENQLRLRGARRALAHVVGEPERLGHGQQGLDGEEGRALVHGFRLNTAAAAGEHVVDAA